MNAECIILRSNYDEALSERAIICHVGVAETKNSLTFSRALSIFSQIRIQCLSGVQPIELFDKGFGEGTW